RPEEWRPNGAYRVHTGNGFGWARKRDGVLIFTTPKPKGGVAGIGAKHFVWVVDYIDDRNQVEYSLHSNGDVDRKVIVNGKADSKRVLQLGTRDTYTLTVEIDKDRIAVSSRGKTDAYSRPNAANAPGKVGFKSEANVQIVQ